MAYRTVERELWQHPVMRQGSQVAGRLFLYLMTSGADCEGRFSANTLDLLEGCFSRRHEVSEEEVATALTELADEFDLVLLYVADGKPFGFLEGWFEHQKGHEKGFRTPSSLPAPPLLANSWITVDLLMDYYCDFHGQKRTHRQTVLAWFEDLPEEERDALCVKLGVQRGDSKRSTTVTQQLDKSNKPKEVKGSEVKGSNGNDVNGGSDVVEGWAEFQQLFQGLWPGGVPEGFRRDVRLEFNATDPEVAKQAARKTVRVFRKKSKYEWPQVLEYACKVMAGLQAEGPKPDDGLTDRDRERNATLAAQQAEIDRQFAEEAAL